MATIIRRPRSAAATTEPAAPRPTRGSRPTSTHAPEISKEELFKLVKRDLWDLKAASDYTGLPTATLSIYHGPNRQAMPSPEIYIGDIPCWHRSTIEEWDATRPKRGVRK